MRKKGYRFVNTIRPLQNPSVEALVDMHCSRVLFGGLTNTTWVALTQEDALIAVQKLAIHDHIADYRFNQKRSEWYVTVKH